jgi:hypothetical protein
MSDMTGMNYRIELRERVWCFVVRHCRDSLLHVDVGFGGVQVFLQFQSNRARRLFR